MAFVHPCRRIHSYMASIHPRVYIHTSHTHTSTHAHAQPRGWTSTGPSRRARWRISTWRGAIPTRSVPVAVCTCSWWCWGFGDGWKRRAVLLEEWGWLPLRFSHARTHASCTAVFNQPCRAYRPLNLTTPLVLCLLVDAIQHTQHDYTTRL